MGTRVLITGASSGVGLATAQLLASSGYTVTGTCTSIQKFQEHNRSFVNFTMVELDLSSIESINRCFTEHIDPSQIDIFIANAGIGEIGAVEDTPLEQSRKLFEVNYFGHVAIIKLLIPHMRKRNAGHIVALGSLVSHLAFPFKAQYCASKSALTSFLLALDFEVQNYGIKIQILEPGWIRSNFHNRLRPTTNSETPYQYFIKPFLDHSKDNSTSYPDGHGIAQTIQKMISGQLTKTRVITGPDAKKVTLLLRILPYYITRLLLNRYLARQVRKIKN